MKAQIPHTTTSAHNINGNPNNTNSFNRNKTLSDVFLTEQTINDESAFES